MPDRPDSDGDGPPENALDEALARARRHARRAIAEALEAARALLDAASLATSGASAASHPFVAQADRWIRRASGACAGGDPLADDLAAALTDALDAEIARWEERARSDGDARAVLRAFLGLRELLWEIGVRRAPSDAASAGPASDSRERGDGSTGDPIGADPTGHARRVERVTVQG